MKFDFLSLLESIVQGFVAFVYSVGRTLFVIVRRPVRGPLRLHGLYRLPHRRQIGGVTFLYLAFFLGFYLVSKSLDFTRDAVMWVIWDAIVELPKIKQEDLWPILAGSLIGTTAIDAGLRLLLLGKWRRRRRRELLIAGCEYSLFWAVLAACVLGWYVVQASAVGWSLLAALPWWSYLFAASLPLATAPSALLLMAPARRGGGGVGRASAVAMTALGVALSIIVASSAGIALQLAIEGVDLSDADSFVP